MVSYKILIEIIGGSFAGLEKTTMQKSLNDKCSKWLEELINKNLIQRGEKNKFKKEANNLFNTSTKAFEKYGVPLPQMTLKSKEELKNCLNQPRSFPCKNLIKIKPSRKPFTKVKNLF